MAPALIDNTTDNVAEAVWKKDSRQGQYKEAFQQSAASTKYETEINGSEKFAAAKYPHYLPCKTPCC